MCRIDGKPFEKVEKYYRGNRNIRCDTCELDMFAMSGVHQAIYRKPNPIESITITLSVSL